MDCGTKTIPNIPCLVCNTLVLDTGTDTDADHDNDNHNQSLSSSSSLYLEDKKIIVFLLRTLLEIRKPFKLKFLVTCYQCKETIKQARFIYNEIRELAQKFRRIQKRIVQALKTCPGDDGNGGGAPEVYEYINYYRKLVNDCDYNGFEFPFVVHEDDLDSSKFQPSLVPVTLKEEQEQVVEEENTGYKQVVLFLPEVDEEEGDNGDGDEDPLSQMDSKDDEKEDEKDSDFNCSEMDSAEEKDDDDDKDKQISHQHSEGQNEDDDQVSSRLRPRRHRKRRLKEKPYSKPSNPFQCPLCTHTLKTFYILTGHLKKSHPGNSVSLKELKSTFKDLLCDRPSKTKRPRAPQKITEKRCNPNNPFPCPECPCRLKTFGNLRLHLKTFHPNNQISMDDLRLKFYPSISSPTEGPPPPPELRKSNQPGRYIPISYFEQKYPHIICKRNSQGKFPCPWTEPSACSKFFTLKPSLHRHITVHHLNLPLFTCTWSGGEGGGDGTVCGKIFATRKGYLEHYDKHRGTPRWKCEDCGMTFYRRNNFTRHKQMVHLNEKHVCEICGEGFPCQEYLYVHRSEVHMGKGSKNQHNKKKDGGGDRPGGIICDFCGKILSNKLTLKGHVEAIHEKVPGKFCCHLCGKRFRWSTHLNMHLWEKHQFKAEGFQPKEKVARKDRFQCGVKGCKKPFWKKENLDKHGIEVHGEDGKKLGPWNCKYCGKNFFWKEKWEHCERTHENKESRPEKCEICGKGFPTKEHLKFHLRHTHKMKLEWGWKGKIQN